MVKRRKEEKEMGGAEKIRMKKKKMLAQEAAKCAKLTDLFRTEKGAVAGGAYEEGPSSMYRTGARLSRRAAATRWLADCA